MVGVRRDRLSCLAEFAGMIELQCWCPFCAVGPVDQSLLEGVDDLIVSSYWRR